MAAAETMVARWGAPAVTLCFLTIGIQTAVITAAGVMRMPLRRFVPAALLGSLMWAALYTTVGLAAWEAWLLGEGKPWLLLLVPIVTVSLVTWRLRASTACES